MPTRHRGLGLVIVSLALVGTACSSKEPGNPTTSPDTTARTTTSAAPSTSKNDRYGAPDVQNPLDASKFLPQPCAVLTAEQMKPFNISKPGKPTTTGAVAETVGPYCSWTSEDEPTSRGFSVGLLPGNKNGLADTYRGRKQFKYFEPTTVDGYPAVFNDGIDARPSGSCSITVGISQTLAFGASETSGKGVGPGACEGARQLASAVIATLKAGG